MTDLKLDIEREVFQAEERIRPYIRQTYLQRSPAWSAAGGGDVFFKLENLQHTGSFKARGALSKLSWLSPEQRGAGVVIASTGNHGAASAYAMAQTGAKGTIFVPENASPVKINAIEALGGQLRYFGDDSVAAERRARAFAAEKGLTYISPYNDPQVIGGQGTIGLELAQQAGQLDAVFVSLGGGGLVAGIAGILKTTMPDVQIIACSPKNSQVMAESIRAGKILELPSLPTLSDGTAGGVEEGSITFEPCRRLIDDYLTITEQEIAAAMRRYIETEHLLLEGSAGVACAGYLQTQERWRGKRVAIVVCGGNISPDVLGRVLTI